MYEPEWVFPESVSAALSAVRDAGGAARAIAGGTDLAVAIKNGAEQPDVLVDLGRLRELARLEDSGDDIVIGACVTHGELASSGLSGGMDVLKAACGTVGAPQIRARATIGGNVANASPAADAAVALTALDARVRVEREGDGGRAEDVRPISEFMLGPGETSLGKDELVTAFLIERPSRGSKGLYLKLGQRNALAIAIVSVAVVYDVEAGRIRIAVGSSAPTPVRAVEAEQFFEEEWSGRSDADVLIEEVAKTAAAATSPIDDVRASAAYRKALAHALVRRALRDLCT